MRVYKLLGVVIARKDMFKQEDDNSKLRLIILSYF